MTEGGMKIRLLGGFELELGSRSLSSYAFSRRKPRNLIKLLALQPRFCLHRDQVIELLWPDLDPEAAASQLYNTVHQARKALCGLSPETGRRFLEFRHGQLSLIAAQGLETDVANFVRLTSRARISRSIEDLNSAVAAYGGLLLPEDLYEEWTLQARVELQNSFLDLLDSLGQAHLAEGRHDLATEAYKRTLELEPASEEAHRGLMKSFACAGQKDLLERQYVACVHALAREYSAEPSAETHELLAGLREQIEAPLRFPTLPTIGVPFVGRQFELSEIDKRLSDPSCRLLTITGLGGIGKTRLAIEAARRFQRERKQAAYLVPLAETSSSEQLMTAIAESLELNLQVGGDIELKLLHALRDRRLLLVLDNAEHAAPAGIVLNRLITSVPGLKILAASRQPLGLSHEFRLEIQGLEVPRYETGVEPKRFAAVQLLLQGARISHSPERLDVKEMAEVAKICRLLQGVPLALELASSWLDVLSAQEIAEELAKGLDVLSTTSPDVPERHRSMRSAFEHTWLSLNEEERTYFPRLSVFQNGFRLEAGSRITGLPLAVLGSLVNKSLVRKEGRRYTIHPVLRQFAEEKLAMAGEEGELRSTHSDFYCRLLQQQERELSAGAEGKALEELRPELDNIGAAWQHAVSTGDIGGIGRGTHGLFVLYEKLGWSLEGEQTFAAAVERLESLQLEPETEVGLARLLARRAAFAHRLGRAEEARNLLDRSRKILEALQEPEELAFVLDKAGVLAHERGDDGEAEELLWAGLRLRKKTGDDRAVATSLNNLGSLAFALGELDQAERFCQESLAISQNLQGGKTVAISLMNLASIAFSRGQQERAEILLAEGLALARAADNNVLCAILLTNLASASAARGSYEEAENYFLQALQDALAVGAESVALDCLPRLASLLHSKHEDAKAIELCSLVLQHPLSHPDTRSKAQHQLMQSAAVNSPQSTEAAQERGRALLIQKIDECWLRAEG